MLMQIQENRDGQRHTVDWKLLDSNAKTFAAESQRQSDRTWIDTFTNLIWSQFDGTVVRHESHEWHCTFRDLYNDIMLQEGSSLFFFSYFTRWAFSTASNPWQQRRQAAFVRLRSVHSGGLVKIGFYFAHIRAIATYFFPPVLCIFRQIVIKKQQTTTLPIDILSNGLRFILFRKIPKGVQIAINMWFNISLLESEDT